MQAVVNQPWPAVPRSQSRPRAARWAVKALFFLNGALFATWASRIPAVKAAHGLSDAGLGMALLSIALGALIAMPLAGGLIARFGSDRVSRASAIAYGAMLPVIVIAPNLATFILALFAFGASHGALDVSMNAQAVAVEQRYGKPIMSSFHALWSTGGLVGAATGGLLAGQGMNPLIHFSLVGVLFGGSLIPIFPNLLNGSAGNRPSAGRSSPIWSLPSQAILALGLVALCVMVGEGAMADWSAVYLRDRLRTGDSMAALGYAAFSVAMAAGRFLGDSLTARLGPARLVRFGGTLAAGGLALALVSGNATIALFGFALVGAGFATLVPIVFSAAGNTRGMAPGAALAAVSTLGYLGFLLSPPMIGFVSQYLGLPAALGIIVVTSLIAAALAPTLGRQRSFEKFRSRGQ